MSTTKPDIIQQENILADLLPIQEEMQEMLGIKDLFQKRRFRPLIEARFMFYAYVQSRYKKLTKSSIAWYGRQDHATVLHAVKAHSNLVLTEPNYRQRAQGVFERLDGIFKNKAEDSLRDFLVKYIRNSSQKHLEQVYNKLVIQTPGILDVVEGKENTFFHVEPEKEKEATEAEIMTYD